MIDLGLSVLFIPLKANAQYVLSKHTKLVI
jgi:hypothetical protein